MLLFFTGAALAQESLDHLPLPRWASVATGEINLRTGPGKRYPIDWVIKRKHLPVEIVREFEHWRQVKEPGGDTGWVHKSMLAGVRWAMLKDEALLLGQPQGDARVIARLKKNVLTRIKSCGKEWCQLQTDGFEGWTPKNALWGVYPAEEIE